MNIEFEQKVREKLDKKELEDIESIFWICDYIEKMMENVELQMSLRTKKMVEKTELKKAKA